jgi:hypothetical protein
MRRELFWEVFYRSLEQPRYGSVKIACFVGLGTLFSLFRDIALRDNRVTFVGIDVNQIALLVIVPIGKGVRRDGHEVIEAKSKGKREKA